MTEPNATLAVRQTMRPHLIHFSLVWGLLLGWIVPAQAEISEKIRAEIMVKFPQYEPPAAGAQPAAPFTPRPQSLNEDPLVNLPDYTVEEKRVIVRDPDLWLGKRALAHKAMSEYSDSMTDLEWALNSWYIPLFGSSPQARANAAYRQNKILSQRKQWAALAAAVATIDPADAKQLLRDMDLSRHPGK